MNGKARGGLILVAALYMLYISWDLYRSRGDTATTMTPAARTVFIVLFILAGGGLAVYAIRTLISAQRDGDDPPKDDTLK